KQKQKQTKTKQKQKRKQKQKQKQKRKTITKTKKPQFAGLRPVGLLAELTNKDGTMSRLSDCQVFAEKHGLLLITIEALVAWRLKRELAASSPAPKVTLLAQCSLPIKIHNKYLGEWGMRYVDDTSLVF